MGFTQGLLAGTLVATSLAYTSGSLMRRTANTVHSHVEGAINNDDESSNKNVSNVHIIYTRSAIEGVKDLWNEEVISAVDWWYRVDVGGRCMALIGDAFKKL